MSFEDHLAAIPEVLRPAVATVWEKLADQIPPEWNGAEFASAARVLAASPFVRQRLVLAPTWLAELPQRPPSVDFPALGQEDFDAALRVHRNAVMAHLAWRELAASVPAQATVEALSDLADRCIRAACDHHRQRLTAKHGRPRARDGASAQFAVFALGKLGGRELNFSSDVDLVLAYSQDGETDGEKCLSNQQFFNRLGQGLLASLENRTAEGFVFRVDMRLRPFGEKSALAHSLPAMEEYYEAHGRDWERYAWVKARPVAGDATLARAVLEMLQPFVYRRYLDYGAIQALREMKAQIDEQVRQRGNEQDIKLGWGGIREVEFIAQVFQLVRGGAEPALRSSSLMEALDVIQRLGLYPAEKIAALRASYWFLRRVENCWQAQRDQQSHVLPHNEEPRQALACGLGFADWAAMEAELQRHRAIVHAEFAQLFAEPDEEGGDLEFADWWRDAAELPAWARLPETLESLKLTTSRRVDQAGEQAAVGRLLGLFWPDLRDDEQAGRVGAVLERIIGRGTYIRLLADNGAARREFLHLCASSDWLAREMASFPAVLAELLDPVQLYAPDERAVLRRRLREHLGGLPDDDIEARLDVLRRVRHASTLRIAAADVAAALPIMRVSDRLTELAEEILRAALDEAIGQMRQRYPDLPRLNFAVIAYGKLGGLELGYSSDLDLVFLYEPAPDAPLPLDAAVFYTRLAQKLIHCLATPTGAGTAYEIDTRLRPSGASGLLVTSLEGLASYQREKAWTWEHQALIRARPVAGAENLGEAFNSLRQEILSLPRDRQRLLADVREMREKMRVELAPRDETFNPKHSPGGIVDIEFLVQLAVLARAGEHAEVGRFTDVIRNLESLVAARMLKRRDGELLESAYRQLRAQVHDRFLTGAADPDADLRALCADIHARLPDWQEQLIGGAKPDV